MENVIPEWFKRAAVYQINLRTFSEEGTIKSATRELSNIASLGFKIMYLCPIFKADVSDDKKYWSKRQLASNTDNPKNPYRISDYFEIDEEYGMMDDLREFVRVSHELGMRVMLDLVYFHIGPNAPVLKSHPEFAIRDESGNIVYGEWNFPVLNYDCEGLREYLYANMAYYVGEVGVDGFRCDVGDRVPLDFWREAKRRIRAITPDAVLLNEGYDPEYSDVFDANYGYPWHDTWRCYVYDMLNKSMTAKDTVRICREYKDDGLILFYMDSHDTVTDWPYRIEKHFGHDAMDMILTMNYTIAGVPMVYSGNELADTARLSMFANRFHRGTYETTDRRAQGDAVEKRKSLIKKGFLMHCYSESKESAQKYLELGAYFAFGGAITFKNAKKEDIIKSIPLNRVLCETDCPYMAPVPYRGNVNESSYIALVYNKMADTYGVGLEQLVLQIRDNAYRFFGKKEFIKE